MKPMELKEPTKCCSAPLLAWVADKGCYVCPCGKMRANSLGLPVRKFVCFNPIKRYRRRALE